MTTTLAAHVRRSIDAIDDRLEVAVFGSGDPDLVAGHLDWACREAVGRPVAAFSYRAGVGIVVGWELHGGERVIGKVHRWNVSVERLTAVRTVQGALADAGLPAPRPLGAIVPCGAGYAAFESHRPGGTADGRAPAVRAELAAGLHRLVRAAAPLAGSVDVGRPMLIRPAGAPLWPEPHDVRFDFAATATGAAWIDELAHHARGRLDGSREESVIGHFDWRVENVGFDAGRLSAIYDWDSLGAAPEPVLVGSTAAQFGVDWTAGDPDPVPTIDDMRAFVADYERARGARFTPAQLDLLEAANLALIAYGARCQHSDVQLRPGIGPGAGTGWLRLLRERRTRPLVADRRSADGTAGGA